MPNQSLALVPNPHHFAGKACLQRIEFVREPDPTAMVTDFRAGNLDMIWQVRPTDVPALRSNSTSFLQPKGVSGAHVWELDVTSEPFNDVRARQALSYAIDRRTMNRAAFSGLATPVDRQLADQRDERRLQQEAEAVHVQPPEGEAALRRGGREARGRRSPSGRSRAGATSGSRWPRSCSRTCRRSASTCDRALGREHVAGEVLPGRQEVSEHDHRRTTSRCRRTRRTP